MDELTDAQLLYDIINDFIRETGIPIIQLLGVFEIIKIEQSQFLIPDDEDIN